ncbi:outer membrane beta-barrel protein [Parapedobacter indicus]|uniref:outer membrane beta-barrel protein n=1 Tax=Parapedobacter indicus TaxID=1477437 RepID=UPI001C42EE1C
MTKENAIFFNAILTHKVNEKFQIAYSYNRRITRPNYRLLNPYSFYVDPCTFK